MSKNYDWYIRKDGKGNPGGNEWRANNVSVDVNGNLRLKVTKQDGLWTCAEVGLNETLGYGDYTFTVANPLKYDKNIVAAGFTYLDDSNELDIELSAWGNLTTNAGFTVQPVPYTADNHVPFNLPTDLPNTQYIIYHWPNDIGFLIKREDGTFLKHWRYAGTHTPAEKMYFLFQIWLAGGKPPSDGKPAELVISDFQFIPMASPDPTPEAPSDDLSTAIAELREELASQQKLTRIRAIANSTATNANKIKEIKTIV